MSQGNGRPRFAIITGDDFGSSSAVNQGIIEAHERGVLTSASLMVRGEAFEEAVALAKSHPRLAVGLHLVVSSGRSVPELIRTGWRFQFKPQVRRELHLEIRAQLEKFRQTGLVLSHVDGHQHMHVHPVVLGLLIEMADEFGIRAVRLPGEELGITLRVDRGGLLTKLLYSWVFGWLRRYGARRLQAASIEFADRVYGLLQTGRMTEEYLLGLIPRIPAARVEIYSHPTVSFDGGDPEGASRAQLEALLSEGVRRTLVSSGFQLATYRALKGSDPLGSDPIRF